MNTELILRNLRRFYLGLSAFIFVGSLVELVSINHTQEPIQWTPFLLSVLGLGLIGWYAFSPNRMPSQAFRAGMAVIILGSLVGVGIHLAGNLEFALEINQNLTLIEKVGESLGGANPLMAPGILAIAAILAASVTYGQKR